MTSGVAGFGPGFVIGARCGNDLFPRLFRGGSAATGFNAAQVLRDLILSAASKIGNSPFKTIPAIQSIPFDFVMDHANE